jgi:hypothetical protein
MRLNTCVVFSMAKHGTKITHVLMVYRFIQQIHSTSRTPIQGLAIASDNQSPTKGTFTKLQQIKVIQFVIVFLYRPSDL